VARTETNNLETSPVQGITFSLKPTPHFEIDGRQVAVIVTKSARAKKMKLKIRSNGSVELVLPKRASLKRGYEFVVSEKVWVARMVQNVEPSVAFAPGISLPILGIPHTLSHAPEMRRGVWQEDGNIFVSGEIAHFPRRLRDWIKREAKQILIRKVDYYAEKIDKPVRRITIRDQKSRWGSCSSAGNLNFSWRLLLMPEKVMSYIVAHEVAHLEHMNHSQEFWELVESLCPDMEESKHWLKMNGTSLHKYDTTI